MAKTISFLETKDSVDLTPMIDVVFLLLAFFMVTTDLTQESDLGITLPAMTPPDPDASPPDENTVDILPSGEVRLNGLTMDNQVSIDMPQLVSTLSKLKGAADRGGQRTAVTIVADPDSLHERSIAVLNACAAAKIKYVMFSSD
ncbi:ExbD/TolR family protein [Cerasicoccus arenae]|uniref:Biopolymer transporter ExbD n=1 Tax=Cerasicoccus arenae TaxID=424488 RepID=A0A8J3DHE2_9BACT|nr:biopolymer transporter ExbD [Cerasicoccus arenae]MBK1856746.1 biopolymer transporter ExbD [Cerasicoccus arenae]GHB99239.1 biopolymer transporter ExbD [Cerasicoccus arenae]